MEKQKEILMSMGVDITKMTNAEINNKVNALFQATSSAVQGDIITKKAETDKKLAKLFIAEQKALHKAIAENVKGYLPKIKNWHFKSKKANKKNQSFSLGSLTDSGWRVTTKVLIEKVSRKKAKTK